MYYKENLPHAKIFILEVKMQSYKESLKFIIMSLETSLLKFC
jgi:hypothetical protein